MYDTEVHTASGTLTAAFTHHKPNRSHSTDVFQTPPRLWLRLWPLSHSVVSAGGASQRQTGRPAGRLERDSPVWCRRQTVCAGRRWSAERSEPAAGPQTRRRPVLPRRRPETARRPAQVSRHVATGGDGAGRHGRPTGRARADSKHRTIAAAHEFKVQRSKMKDPITTETDYVGSRHCQSVTGPEIAHRHNVGYRKQP